MGKRSKEKGSSFEREMAAQLSLWLSNGNHRDWFVRSQGSGASSWVRKQKGGSEIENQAGDIAANSVSAHALMDKICVECKHLKFIGLHQFFSDLTDTPLLQRIYEEAATKTEKALWLIAKENRQAPIIVVSVETALSWLPITTSSGIKFSHGILHTGKVSLFYCRLDHWLYPNRLRTCRKV